MTGPASGDNTWVEDIPLPIGSSPAATPGAAGGHQRRGTKVFRLAMNSATALVVLTVMLGLLGAAPLGAQPHLCTEAVFEPLAKGYQALRAGNDDLARVEFDKVLQIDAYNPYALNNLAVLAERQGKLKEAMAYLLRAETYAAEYLHKPGELCEGGGLCVALAPSAEKGQASSIAAVVRSNIHLLRLKIGQAPVHPAEPSGPPPE